MINTQIPKWVILNNEIIDSDGNIVNLDKDLEAAEAFLEGEVKPKLLRFKTLEEKLKYLIDNEYYEEEFLNKYSIDQIKEVYNIAYNHNFKFPTYMGISKFFNDYALKTRDQKNYLETYEDRLSVVALYHANGDFEMAKRLIKSLINQDFTPATPIILNTGKKHRGEFVSCFLLEAGDSLNDISRISEFSMQLSKIGGGVAINLNSLRAKGESIKGIPNVSKGVVGVAKLLDNNFRYADQMGQRTGAGVAYLSVFHADIIDFLQTKKLNADDDIRLATLSLGVVIPNKMIELAKENKDMYVFYPHTIYQEYGVDFNDVAADIDSWYDKLVENPNVRKRAINPRQLLQMITQVQGESGYPYVMFIDNVNKENPLAMPVKFSNLCTEILQPTITSHYADYDKREDDQIGLDVSCNLSSGHIGNMIENNTIKETVFAAMDVMNSVSKNTELKHVPGVYKANNLMRSVGFGMMGLHGFLAKNMILYGSEESIELVDVFFNIVNYYSLVHSNQKAIETKEIFYTFETSKYADGTYFDNRGAIYPKSEEVAKIFENIYIPTDEDWNKLKESVMKHGLYNSHRLAVAPNGSTSYLMSATASLTPIKQLVEERTFGRSHTFFPMPHLKEAEFMYETSYDIDNYKVIDLIATVQKHIDQGVSMELGITSLETTRDIQRYYLYAHHKGIKTVYYIRTRKLSIEECESCVV
ncbi:MAG: class 1b ribonucleoside-diphosphate reductase subunit alpha [Acholeplasmataceae bacterium]|jgi:ribonucleoside-diphosphate reductase alpha chain|nr:class 1b ribonucleoside-diphosphate reductase subunit alpha [Acholeplasmataceae bacterium]